MDEDVRTVLKKDFLLKAKRLLTDIEREDLTQALREYRSFRDLAELTYVLRALLNTPEKLDIADDIRRLFIAPLDQGGFLSLLFGSGNNRSNSPSLSGRSTPHTHRSSPRSPLSRSPSSASEFALRCLNVLKKENESAEEVGLFCSGGKELGTNVVVTRVVEGSLAARAGFRPFDQIIDINGLSCEGISLPAFLDVLHRNQNLNISVKSPRRSQSSPENGRDSVSTAASVTLNHDGISLVGSPRRQERTSWTSYESPLIGEIREITVIADGNSRFLGFSIRGGLEFGLGIYVSNIDQGSPADRAGLVIGDLVLMCNSRSFEKITHKEAAHIIRHSNALVLTVQATGRVPEARHLVAEYTWLTNDNQSAGVLSSIVRDLSPEFGRSTPDTWTNSAYDNSDNPVGNSTVGDEEAGSSQSKLRRPQSSDANFDRSSTAQSSRGNPSRVQNSSFNSIDLDAAEPSFDTLDRGSKKKSFLRRSGKKLKDRFSKKKGNLENAAQNGSSQPDSLNTVLANASSILTDEDYQIFSEHLKLFNERLDVDFLIHGLKGLIDSPEKVMLLRDIRTLISPSNLGRFDGFVVKMEAEYFPYTMNDNSSPVLGVPFSEKPPRRTLVAAVKDDRSGKFKLARSEHAEAMEQSSKRTQHVFAQTGSILDRNEIVQTYDATANVKSPISRTSNPPTILLSPEKGSPVSPVPPSTPINVLNGGDTNSKFVGETSISIHRQTLSDCMNASRSQSPAAVMLQVPKQKSFLGMSISGGRDSIQPEIRVEKIYEGGSAADVPEIKAGMRILSVDEIALTSCSHDQAVDIIRRAYHSKTTSHMVLLVVGDS